MMTPDNDGDEPGAMPAAATATPHTEPDGDEAEGPMAENEVCIDLASLAMPDDQDQMQPPEVGDKVQASIEGEVSRIVGGKAYVTMTSVNGNPVEAEPEQNEAQEEAGIRQDVGGLPEGY